MLELEDSSRSPLVIFIRYIPPGALGLTHRQAPRRVAR